MYKISFTAQGLIELECSKKSEAKAIYEALRKAELSPTVINNSEVKF